MRGSLPSATISIDDRAVDRLVLEGEQVVSRFLPVASVEEMRAKVLETPGAVGIGPSSLVSRGVRVPGSLTVAASVMLITKGEPSPKVQKLLDLLKDGEGLTEDIEAALKNALDEFRARSKARAEQSAEGVPVPVEAGA